MVTHILLAKSTRLEHLYFSLKYNRKKKHGFKGFLKVLNSSEETKHDENGLIHLITIGSPVKDGKAVTKVI